MSTLKLHSKKVFTRLMVLFTVAIFVSCHITIMFVLSESEQFQTMLNMGMEEEHSHVVNLTVQEIDGLNFGASDNDLLAVKSLKDEQLFYNEPIIDQPPRPPRH